MCVCGEVSAERQLKRRTLALEDDCDGFRQVIGAQALQRS